MPNVMRNIVAVLSILLIGTSASAQGRKVSIDKSITGFTFEHTEGDGTIIYTQKDYNSYQENESFVCISIMPFPPGLTIEDGVLGIEDEVEKSRSEGAIISDFKKEVVSFGGYSATAISMHVEENGAASAAFIAFIDAGGEFYVYIGEDVKNGNHMDKIRQTLKTFKIN